MEMTLLETILTILLGAMAIAGALAVILSRNLVYSAIALLVNFCALGALYILLSAEFLGIVQLIVYGGAIVVLFLFALMLVGGRRKVDEKLLRPIGNVIAIGLGILLVLEMGYVFLTSEIAGQTGRITPEVIGQEGHIQILGSTLFNEYLLPFELISILLLVAIVGAVVLAKSPRKREVQE
jgi:NADH-quinone oxidoreductase subunit J